MQQTKQLSKTDIAFAVNLVYEVYGDLPLEDIRNLSAQLTDLGYQVRFELNEFFYSFNVYWI